MALFFSFEILPDGYIEQLRQALAFMFCFIFELLEKFLVNMEGCPDRVLKKLRSLSPCLERAPSFFRFSYRPGWICRPVSELVGLFDADCLSGLPGKLSLLSLPTSYNFSNGIGTYP